MLIDLHNHTWPRSHDSVLHPEDLIQRAKAAGIDGICLTEHDKVWDEATVQQMAEKHEFLVIPGVEITCDDGHMLAFGVERYIFGMHRVEKLAAHVSSRGGCLVGAHPYRNQIPWDHDPQSEDDPEVWRQHVERAAKNPAYIYCVALEVLNGRGRPRENSFSEDVLEFTGMRGTAGTDSHAVHDIGRVATYFDSDSIETWQDLVRELKNGRFCAVDMVTGKEIAVPIRPKD